MIGFITEVLAKLEDKMLQEQKQGEEQGDVSQSKRQINLLTFFSKSLELERTLQEWSAHKLSSV